LRWAPAPSATHSATVTRLFRRPSGPLFLHHAHLDLGAHVGMELDPDPELAQLPDRLREVHPALVDADPELLELALHVARGDGTVQLVLDRKSTRLNSS